MKKIYKTVLFALISNFLVAQSFFEPTTYRGAFAPAPAPMWTDSWTNWDPQNTTYPNATVTVTANITNNTTWTSNNTYLLGAPIYVKNGATLTIEPGTVILGDKAVVGAGLFICQGAKLNAVGTVSQPIVFTSNQAPGARAPGDWGGIILLGRGSCNAPVNVGNGTPAGVANIEGIAVSFDTQYGGGASPDNTDNSGVMQYVRIEFGGYIYAIDKEINGLTFGAVGSGTTIDHIQTSFINDDAYEWFGGAVNCRYLVSFRNIDDDFDTDFGFSGKVQFGLSVRDPLLDDQSSAGSSEGFESDNDASGTTNTPLTAALFSNMTLIGPYRGSTSNPISSHFNRAARIRRNSNLKIYNSIFMDHKKGIYIDGALCEGNATSGALKFMNNIVVGNSTGKVCEVNSGSTFDVRSWFATSMNDSAVSSAGILVTPYNYTAPDYRPATGSLALSGSGFIDAAIAPYVLYAPAVTSPATYCVGETASALTATAINGNTLNWYSLPTGGVASTTTPTPSTVAAGTTVYYVAQANAEGYEGPRSLITVVVNPLPSTPVITASGSTSFCTGSSIVLSSSASTGNTWSGGATTNTLLVDSSGSYTVTVQDGNGCEATSLPTLINVSNAPVPTVAVSGSTAICAGQTVILTASVSDTYLWSPGSQTTQSITVTAAGAYNVTTTNSNACDGTGASANTTVTVSSVPTAAGSVASTSGYNVMFANASTGATSYNWDFGDLSNSSAATPTHAYATNGNYTVKLIASNGTCSDTSTFNVTMTVGISEMQTFSGVNLYPNPLSHEATIDVNLNETAKVIITVYDVTGKAAINVFAGQMNVGVNSVKINTVDLPAGIYYTTIVSNKTMKTVKTVIIK